MDYIKELSELKEIYEKTLDKVHEDVEIAFDDLVEHMKFFLTKYEDARKIADKLVKINEKLSCEEKVSRIMGEKCDDE